MNVGDWKVWIERTDFGGGYDVTMYRKMDEDGAIDLVEPLRLRRVGPHESAKPYGPTFSARQGEAFLRGMLNAIWEMGMRPDGYQDQRETTVATKAHLEDMRALVFAGQVVPRK